MSPNKTIQLLEGSSIELYCSINRDDLNVSLLYFKNVKERLESTIINDTTIYYKGDNLKAKRTNYQCHYGEGCGVKLIDVLIGYKPQNVLNFKCRSYNWQNMNCTFDIPIHNFIETKYTLTRLVEVPGNYEVREI